jgi:thymidylate synthase
METAIDTIIKDLVTNGTVEKAGTWQATDDYKDFNMLVKRNQYYIFSVPNTIHEMARKTRSDRDWANEHFEERVSGLPTNPGESYKNWPYNTFKSLDDPYMDGKQFSHTYQERFWPKFAGDTAEDPREGQEQGIRYPLGDLGNLINQLKENNLTRQAYLPIFFPEDTGAVHKERVPCTLGYLFNIYNNKLHCTYYIRSCDAFRHFRNDVYLAMRLMDHIRDHIDITIQLGDLHMHIAHFHIFENDQYALNKKESWL